MNRDTRSSAPSGLVAGIQGRVRKFVSFLFVILLVAALWSTALARISERQTAVSLLTRAGTDLINPLLIKSGTGLAQGAYVQLQKLAIANPNGTLPIGFIKVPVIGQSIIGKDFTGGSRTIYRQIAQAYYDGGAGNAFSLSPELQKFVSTYTPFIQPDNLTAIANNAGVNVPTIPQSPLPQIPAVFGDLFATVGVTPNTLTASAHAADVSRSYWLWLVCVVLAGIVALLSTGWERLSNVAWAVFNASWVISLVGIIATILVTRNPIQSGPYRGILDIIGNTFMPVFYGAALAGLIAIIASFAGHQVTKNLSTTSRSVNPSTGMPNEPYYNQPYGSETQYHQPLQPEYPYQPQPENPNQPRTEYPYQPRPEYPNQSGQGYPHNSPSQSDYYPPQQPSTQPLDGPQSPRPPYRNPQDPQTPPRQW